MNDEINVLSSHFPVSVNNVRSPLSIAKKERKRRKKSVDIIDLDLIEERRRRKKSFPLSFPYFFSRERRRLIITCRIGAAERQVRTDIYIYTQVGRLEHSQVPPA